MWSTILYTGYCHSIITCSYSAKFGSILTCPCIAFHCVSASKKCKNRNSCVHQCRVTCINVMFSHLVGNHLCCVDAHPSSFSFSLPCSSPVLSGPTTSQSANKQLDRAEASGGLTYDLKIENIDISYGQK